MDSEESGPRSYSDVVLRALGIDGWDEKVEKSQIAKTYAQENNRAMVPFQGSKRQFQKKKGKFQKVNTREIQGRNQGNSYSGNQRLESDDSRGNKKTREQSKERFIKGRQNSSQTGQGSEVLLFQQYNKCEKRHPG